MGCGMLQGFSGVRPIKRLAVHGVLAFAVPGGLSPETRTYLGNRSRFFGEKGISAPK